MILDDGKLEKLLKLKPGERGNHVLYHLLSPHLFGYWTFLQPKHEGVELADVLFVWDDVCVLFEVKTREKAKEKDEKWVRSKIGEAISTLNARADMLKSGAVKEIRNGWRGTLQWRDLQVKHYWGIIVLNHDSDPYDPRDVAKESLGTSCIPIQVFSLYDLLELIRVVNTPCDFIVYCELRRELGRKFALPVHNENSVFHTVIDQWSELVLKSQGHSLSPEEVREQQDFMREASRVLLGTTTSNDSVCESLSASLLLDVALGSIAAKATPDPTGKRVGGPAHDVLVTAMESIAELTRRRRCFYGTLWLEQARKALKLRLPQHCSVYSRSRRRSYLMAAVHRDSQACNVAFLPEVYRTMARDKSDRCLCLVGKANTIVSTFESLLASVKRESTEELPDSEILNVSVAYVDSGN